MATRWVDMALEARQTNQDPDIAFRQLKEWLSKEISGKETARKTATQMHRLWFAVGDKYDKLRHQVFDNGLAEDHDHWPLLHFGLSLNVFPLFRNVCQMTGRLTNLQTDCRRKDIHQRVQELYGIQSATGAATDRVFQTLVDWGFIIEQNNRISSRGIKVYDIKLTQWLIVALMEARSVDKVQLVDVSSAPELLGIRLEDVRNAVRQANFLRIERMTDVEMLFREA